MLYKQPPSPVTNQAAFDLFVTMMHAGHQPGATRGEVHCAALASAIREHAPHLGDDAIEGAFNFAVMCKRWPAVIDKLIHGIAT